MTFEGSVFQFYKQLIHSNACVEYDHISFMSSHLSWKKYVAPVQKEIYKIQTAKIKEKAADSSFSAWWIIKKKKKKKKKELWLH